MSTPRCRRAECLAPILWAVTEAGKRMPMDPEPYQGDDERANLAVRRDGLSRLVCRVITADRPLMGYERRYMPHWATCLALATPTATKAADVELPDNVIPFPTATARARARKDTRP